MTNKTAAFVPYNPILKKYFEKEALGLKKLLRNNFVNAHHIGSTAITTIVARPTLDILVEVHTLDGIEVFQSEFESVGLIRQYDFDPEEKLCFVRLAPDGVSHLSRIFIFDKASAQVQDYLDFRDYLNAEKEVAKEYENLKITLNDKFPLSSDLYMAAKSEFIETVLKNIT